MPEFAGHAVHAVPNLAAHYYSATDAGAEGQHRHVVKIFRRAQPFLSHGGRIGVILQNDLRLQALLDLCTDRRIDPARQIGRFANHASLHVDNAWYADPDPEQGGRVPVLLHQSLDGIAHVIDNVDATQRDFRAKCHFLDEMALLVNGRNAEIGPA